MALTVDQIIAKFPHNNFPMVEGEPDYQIIRDVWTLPYGNASALSTALGGGNHGHTGLVMQDTL